MKIELPKHSLAADCETLARDTGGESRDWFVQEPSARVVDRIYGPKEGTQKQKMVEVIETVVVDGKGKPVFEDEEIGVLDLSHNGFSELAEFVAVKLGLVEPDDSGLDEKKSSC